MKKVELRHLIASMVESQSTPFDGAVKETVNEALRQAAVEGEVVLICGTAFIMAEARAAVGIVEPKDGDILFQLLGSGHSDMQESFVDEKTQRL